MYDLIDRQAAIDVVWSVSKAVPTMAIRARQALRELPPAEPEISCSEIPNSSELISSQAAINVIAKWMLEYGVYGEEHGINALKQAAEEIKALPPAEPEEHTGERTKTRACDLISRQAAKHALCKAVHKNEDVPCENQTASCLWSKTRVCDYAREIDALPSALPTYTDTEIKKMQDMEQAQLEKAYQLGYEDGKKDTQPETAKRIIGKSRDGMTFWHQCDMCNEPVDVQDNYCCGCGRRLVNE